MPYPVGSGPHAVQAGDLDKDNDLDLVVANQDSNTVTVLFNNGDGTFLSTLFAAGGDSPASVALGDLDSDDNLDITIGIPGTIAVLFNEGEGAFTPPVFFGE